MLRLLLPPNLAKSAPREAIALKVEVDLGRPASPSIVAAGDTLAEVTDAESAPIGLLAYQTGSWVLGEEVKPAAAEALSAAADGQSVDGPGTGWLAKAKAIGKPLFLGLFVFAVVGGLAAWALVHLGWTIGVWLKRRRRRRRQPG